MSRRYFHGDVFRAIRHFEYAVVIALVATMMLVIVVSTLDLLSLVIRDLISPPIVLLGIDELLEILGLVLIVLIAIELLETFKIYMQSYEVRVELVVEVALIAVARKIIVLDIKDTGALGMFSVAALAISLAVASYLARRARAPAQGR